MAKYRDALPQLGGGLFLTDGGIETTLIFHDGLELPYFAAFDLLRHTTGDAALQKYFRTYAELAARFRTGLVLETATWRANPDWAAKLGYDASALAEANRRAVAMVAALRPEFDTAHAPLVISGCIGPRGDGYVPVDAMTAQAAEAYHRFQVDTFAASDADLVTAITMNYVEEAIGIAHAARAADMPVVISFTVETDGQLPTGQSLGDAIREVDTATSAYPAYFMINCAHPSHFERQLETGAPWLSRIRGLRANASRSSHAELNDAVVLDAGDPRELGDDYARLIRGPLPHLGVVGGCCGTDDRHVARIAAACLPLHASPR